MIHVAVDAMGCERGIDVAVQGALESLKDIKDLSVILVGDPAGINSVMPEHPYGNRLQVQPSSEVITMDDDPAQAFKTKKDASVSVACRLVKEGKAQAALSSGNTGASMTAATLVLGRLKGVRRPAIMILMPHPDGFTCLLDAGAVVDCKPEDLVQWALMGDVFSREIAGKKDPRVGLLSIGEEDKKGNELTSQAFPMMKAAPFNFIGNVEGRDYFNNKCDVIVCDGFVGNIVLKVAEGLAKSMMSLIKNEYKRGSVFSKIGAWFSKPVFTAAQKIMSADSYGGASLLGVNGIFIITHGSASSKMIKNAIRVCCECASHDLMEKMADSIEKNEGSTQ